MKTFQSIYLAPLIATFIVHISCIHIDPKNITLYEFQPESLASKMSGSGGPESVPAKVAMVATAATTVTQFIPGIAEITNAVYAVSNTMAYLEQKNQDTSNRQAHEAAKQITDEIQIHNAKGKLVDLKDLMSTIKYSITKASEVKNKEAVNDADTRLFHVITSLANVDSPFHSFPTVVAPLLLALPKIVEPFMKNLAPQALLVSSKVACNLMDVMQVYFKRILLERLIHINVESDYNKFFTHNKYTFMKSTAAPKFDPNVSIKDTNVDCFPGEGGNATYEYKVRQFGGYIETNDPILSVKKNTTVYIPNKKEFKDSLMRDGLTSMDTYYHEYDTTKGKCISGYFKLVRRLLEKAFADGYKKVQPLCINRIQNRKMTSTGRGMLTITVGALLAVGNMTEFGKEPFHNACDGLIFPSPAHFCDPYVRVIVGNTEYFTQSRIDRGDWISLDETFHFPNLDKNTKVRIQVWDWDDKFNGSGDDEIMDKEYSITDLVNGVLFETPLAKLLMVSTWFDEIDDANFQQFVHSKV